MTEYDPYDMNYYYMHSKGNEEKKHNNKNVFNPYEDNKKIFNPNDNKTSESEDLPKYVDLNKNLYEQKKTNNTDTEEELPLLEGILY